MADFPANLAVIGHPIAHSLSPVMHQAAFRELDINACYTGYDVAPERLHEVVGAMRTLNFRGWNVTIPHKVAIMSLLDELTPAAKRIGAVNTVYFQDGLWIGDNTDGQGYLSSLSQELSLDVRGKHVVVLGAGGAAKAIADALLFAGVGALWILNRHREKAEALASQLAVHHTRITIVGSDMVWPSSRVDLVINTTPVGMEGHLTGELPVPASVLQEQMIVSDLVYRPQVTPLLLAAQLAGAKTHGGLGMLVEQGALAFTKWFGITPSVAVMREAALQEMRKGQFLS
jgi:shikimate dehydrogenase